MKSYRDKCTSDNGIVNPYQIRKPVCDEYENGTVRKKENINDLYTTFGAVTSIGKGRNYILNWLTKRKTAGLMKHINCNPRCECKMSL